MSNIERVIGIIKDNPQGLTIKEIGIRAELARQTISVIIGELKGSQSIRIRPVGKAKLIYWEFKEK